MLSRIHFLHEILLNLLISCRKNKVSYHVFLLLLLVHEVYIENQEPRIEKSDWSIQISYALNKGKQTSNQLCVGHTGIHKHIGASRLR